MILTSIGKEISADSTATETFTYRFVKYEKILLWDRFDKLLGEFQKISWRANFKNYLSSGLPYSCGFFLQNTSVNDERYLMLCYSSNTVGKLSEFAKSDRDYVISNFFEPVDAKDKENEHTTHLTIDQFYEKLKQEHENDDFSSIPENVQHPDLKESTRLRPYQQQGVKWLLKREMEQQEIPSNYIQMRSKFNNDHIMYYNSSNGDFVKEKPESLFYPSGGLLCDEMGKKI